MQNNLFKLYYAPDKFVHGWRLPVTCCQLQVTGNYEKDDYTFLSGMQYKIADCRFTIGD